MTTLKLIDNISRKTDILPKLGYGLFWLVLFVASLGAGKNAYAATCANNTITANVVVLDNPTTFNRLGAQNPNWITYALERDVVYVDWGNPRRPNPDCAVEPADADNFCKNADGDQINAFIGDSDHLKPITRVNKTPAQLRGKVELRPDKRPRPLVVRSVAGSCLTVYFTNLLAPVANPNNPTQGIGGGFAEPNDNDPNPACEAANGGTDPVEGVHPASEILTAGTPFFPNDGVCVDVDGNVVPDFVDAGVAFAGLGNNDQVAGRCAGFHASGTELVTNMGDDGSMVGKNPGGSAANSNGPGTTKAACGPGLAEPGGTETYHLYTPEEGAFIINSYGATLGSEASGGNLGIGMFGALNVQPKGARIYRSQVTEEEFRLATDRLTTSTCTGAPGENAGADCNPGLQPIIDYEALYPQDCDGHVDDPDPTDGKDGVWCREGKDGLPIINMLTAAGELVHSDINAIIAGPNDDGTFPADTYPLESKGFVNPQVPNRLDAFREFTSQYHDEQTNSQVYPNWYNHPVMGFTLHGVGDAFMINYGSGGIGSEIISNRLRTGPMHDCTDCAYEEFFLASQTVGDPALLVNYPANTLIEACSPENIAAGPNDPNSCWRDDNLSNGPIPGNYALFQEDPSNVHHAYTGDHTKMRNTHAGAFEQHIFHFHNHQWLFNPNDDNANYLDAQEIMPGSGHTYELVNGGAGNRNHTVGDAIFHCHFYPHFAQGMWYHMRNHDVYETGTVLAITNAENAQKPIFEPDPGAEDFLGDNLATPDFDESLDDVYPAYHTTRWALRSGQPMAGARAYPDGELPDGSPIPAIIPLPGKPMPQIPAKVEIVAVDRGSSSLLGGRLPPDPNNPTPDSSQAIVDYGEAKGKDGVAGTADDKSPGYPFWLAGNECGVDIPATLPADRVVEHAACPMGIVGQRMPTPPLDMLTNEAAMDNLGNLSLVDENPLNDISWQNLGGGWDGGLPRHALLGYTSGGASADTQNRLDFRKIIELAQPVYFPETGTEMEKVSMAYQAVRHRPSDAYGTDTNLISKEFPNPDWPESCAAEPAEGDTTCKDLDDNVVNKILTPASKSFFVMNGSPAVPGGPYNDPCVDDRAHHVTAGTPGEWYDSDLPGIGEDRWTTLTTAGTSPFDAENPRTYKLANLQIDAVFNKLGHHYSQERIIILWEDVKPTVLKERPPEPLVMRFNTFDCGKILHANLVPAEFEVDDFQVRTPTDIIGQHIHLPKWDLTSNDGAANGWNYEDGTLSPLMVEERIVAINKYTDKVLACQSDRNKCVIPALTLPGQLGPIDLTGLQPVPVLTEADGADPHSPATNADARVQKGLGLYKLPEHVEHYADAFKDDNNPQVAAGMYLSARTTIQRILVDPVVNVAGVDRGLGLTFSHDHYGPSTFQQIGLYSTILAEPAGSKWVHNESGEVLGGHTALDIDGPRDDGGPTSWQAAILTGEAGIGGYMDNVGGAAVEPHREFYFEMSDFQHAYQKQAPADYVAADQFGIPNKFAASEVAKTEIIQPNPFNATVAFAPSIAEKWKEVVNPPLKTEAQQFPDVVTAKGGCPGPAGNFDPNVPRPCAEAINIAHSSTWVINYRNEPVGYRVFDPNETGPDGQNGAQAKGRAGDLALAFSSSINRAIPQLNTRFGDTPAGYQTGPDGIGADAYCEGTGNGDLINCDRGSGDPFTPIMRVYEGDQTKVKIQVGATEEQHQTTIHGIKWLSNGSGFGRSPNSGWRNFQSHGISEQFSLQAPFNPALRQAGQTVDYLYATDATRPGMWLGTWGILRTYGKPRADLVQLPNNDPSKTPQFVNQKNFTGVCPKDAPVAYFDIAAVLANDVLPNNLGVTIPSNLGIDPDNPVPGDSDGDGIGDNAGGPLNTEGGTLVYNRRQTVVTDPDGPDGVLDGGAGPLNDPTAMMYVLNADLIPVVEQEALEGGVDGPLGSCLKSAGGGKGGKGKNNGNGEVNFDATLPGCAEAAQLEAKGCMLNGSYKSDLATCAAMLKPDAPVEPLVLRANAGDCIEVQLRNRLVTRQAVEKTTRKKVWYSDGRPVMSPIYDTDTYYTDIAAGATVNVGEIEFFLPPDLAGWQDMMWGVTRRIQPGEDADGNPLPAVFDEMHFFNNNLVAPSGYAGIHPQLVEYDASRDDGLWVGKNQPQIGTPGGAATARYYAGHLEYVRKPELDRRNTRALEIVATPVEFGGSNLLSADRIKQPQKGLFGSLVIEPEGATWAVDTQVPDGQGGSGTRPTRAQIDIVTATPAYCASVNAGATCGVGPDGIKGTGDEGDTFREAVTMAHKIANLRWADGHAVKNIQQEELGVEGAEDSGHAGFNYGMEPSWFRFKLPPNAPFGAAKKVQDQNGNPVPEVDGSFGTIPNQQAFYANVLVENETGTFPDGDPVTPVFTTKAGMPTRMYVVTGASADRDSTFILHGHVWQRDPYVCPNDAYLGLPGYCYQNGDEYSGPDSVPSQALGDNPIGKYMGGEEGMGHVYGHWPILFNAGGTFADSLPCSAAQPCDFLFRDYTPSGNRNGMFGILRVE